MDFLREGILLFRSGTVSLFQISLLFDIVELKIEDLESGTASSVVDVQKVVKDSAQVIPSHKMEK